jgi:hypothetical protein
VLQRKDLHACLQGPPAFESDGRIQHFLRLFVAGDDLLDLFEEDVVVVVEEVDFLSLLVEEDAAADVEGVEHLVVVIEDGVEGVVAAAVDAHDATDRADDDLVQFVFLQQALPVLDYEQHQVHDLSYQLVLDLQRFAQLLGTFTGVQAQAFEDGLAAVVVCAGDDVVALLVLPNFLY